MKKKKMRAMQMVQTIIKVIGLLLIFYIILLCIHCVLYIIGQICKYVDKKIESKPITNNIIKMSKCSCCRKTGHKVNNCDDERIQDFHTKCMNYAPILTQDAFKGWLYRQDANLIKALAVRNNAKANISNIYHVEHLTSAYYPDAALCALIMLPSLVTSLQICDTIEPIECPICYGNIPKNVSTQTNCRHSYCSECIGTHLTTKTNCPMCREPVNNLIINLPNINKFQMLFNYKFNI